MTTLTLDTETLATQINITDEKLVIELADGRSLIIPLSWYPRLLNASHKERQNWQLLGDGYAIEWIDLDEHIGIEGLLAGKRSGESQKSFQKWLNSKNPNCDLSENLAVKEAAQVLETKRDWKANPAIEDAAQALYMMLNSLLERKGIIHRDPDIMSGVPVFKGSRVPLQTFFDHLDGDGGLAEFIDDFPYLKPQVMKVLESAAKLLLAQERSA